MDVLEAIRTNRAVRQFADRPLEEDVARAILNAGRRAQSSQNTQPRQFLVIRARETLEKVAQLGPYAGHMAGAAMGVLVLTPQPTGRLSVLMDAGQSIAYMMLAAWSFGVGSAITTLHETEQARRLLSIPPEFEVRYAVSFGYPADPAMLETPPQKGGRRPFDEVVHWETW
jgi:nitroreductase